MNLQILETHSEQEFVRQSVAFLKDALTKTITTRSLAILGLSGGSTPKPIYEALGREKIDWSNVWIFLVDDRYIRADDPNSNQFLLRSTLLKNAPIPESQILFPDTTLPLDKCVHLYDQHINSLLKKGQPDIITLGMGDDGHIASLFPPLTDAAFGPACVIHTTTEKFAVKDRISVTLPVLEKTKQAVFFLKGPAKKNVWQKMMESKEDKRRWPGKRLMEKTLIAILAQW